jgi:hypothetical protein
MASISQAQKSLEENFTIGGVDKTANVSLNNVEAIMVEYAQAFIKKAKGTITKKGKIDTGNLSDIKVGTVVQQGTRYSLTIGYDKNNPASEYYDFQNKGVKGIKSQQPNSPYKFRTLSVSSNFVSAIMAWYMRHQNYIRNEDQRKNLTTLQRKRKTIAKIANKSKDIRKTAEATAKNIKKRGLKRIGFFEDNLDVFGSDFQQKIATALGTDVAINIRQQFKDNGNNNNK